MKTIGFRGLAYFQTQPCITVPVTMEAVLDMLLPQGAAERAWESAVWGEPCATRSGHPKSCLVAKVEKTTMIWPKNCMKHGILHGKREA